MNDKEKAKIYDDCIRENDRLQREINDIKREYRNNIPQNLQETIDRNNKKIQDLSNRIKDLFK